MMVRVCVCYSLDILEVSVAVQDEVRNTGIFLLTAVPEGKLRQQPRIISCVISLSAAL